MKSVEYSFIIYSSENELSYANKAIITRSMANHEKKVIFSRDLTKKEIKNFKGIIQSNFSNFVKIQNMKDYFEKIFSKVNVPDKPFYTCRMEIYGDEGKKVERFSDVATVKYIEFRCNT